MITITGPGKDIVAWLAQVRPAIGDRSPMPEFIGLAAVTPEHLLATNQTLAVCVPAPDANDPKLKLTGDGAFLLDVGRITEVLNAAPSAAVELQVTDEATRWNYRGGVRVRGKLVSLPLNLLETTAKGLLYGKPDSTVTIAGAAFKAALRAVAETTTNDPADIKHLVRLEIAGQELILTSAETASASLARLPLDAPAPPAVALLDATLVLEHILALIDDGEVDLSITPSAVVLQSSSTHINLALARNAEFAGHRFPPVPMLFGGERHTLEVSAADLLAALRQVNAASFGRDRRWVDMKISAGEIMLGFDERQVKRRKKNAVGDAAELYEADFETSLPTVTKMNTPLALRINAKRLEGLVSKVRTDTLRLGYTNDRSPLVVDGGGCQALLLPMTF